MAGPQPHAHVFFPGGSRCSSGCSCLTCPQASSGCSQAFRVKKEISVLLQPWCKVVAMSKSAQGRNLTRYCFDQHIPSVALAEPGWEVPAPPCLMPVLPRLRVPAGTRVGWDMEAAAWVRWALQADDS